MSRRKNERAAPRAPAQAEDSFKTRYVVMAAVAGLLLLVLILWLAVGGKPAATRSAAELAALQRPHAATLGPPNAPVQIVEFMDPACETCRQFYPMVKGMMSQSPGKIRLSIRLVAFHQGSEVAVKALEASKAQGKFFVVLERLFASQPKWVVQHRVDPDAVWAELRAMDLDFERLKADMESPAVAQAIATDAQDAKTMKVAATPEYFVNGRGLPSFGFDELSALVREELAKAPR